LASSGGAAGSRGGTGRFAGFAPSGADLRPATLVLRRLAGPEAAALAFFFMRITDQGLPEFTKTG